MPRFESHLRLNKNPEVGSRCLLRQAGRQTKNSGSREIDENVQGIVRMFNGMHYMAWHYMEALHVRVRVYARLLGQFLYSMSSSCFGRYATAALEEKDIVSSSRGGRMYSEPCIYSASTHGGPGHVGFCFANLACPIDDPPQCCGRSVRWQ